jgi:hypothetical protein
VRSSPSELLTSVRQLKIQSDGVGSRRDSLNGLSTDGEILSATGLEEYRFAQISPGGITGCAMEGQT